MLGKAHIDYSRLLMQLDSETGKYEDAGEQSKGHKGLGMTWRLNNNNEQRTIFFINKMRLISAIFARIGI